MARFCDRCKRANVDVFQISVGAGGVREMCSAELCVDCMKIVHNAAIVALENRVPGVPTYTMRPRWYQRELVTSALCMILGGFLGPFICWAGIYLFHLLRR